MEEIDHIKRGITKSVSAQDELHATLALERGKDLEDRHRAGYAHRPVVPGEFSEWEDEQVWVT